LSLVYPLQTARLILRPFEPGDLDDVAAYMAREDVVRYLYRVVQDRAGSEDLLQTLIASSDMTHGGERLALAVLPRGERGQQRVIGEMTLKWISQEHQQGELGWLFHPAYQGQGYATEAARALLDIGFREFGFHRISAHCDARNTASYKLMERLGMRREAHLIENEIVKGEWSDELIYALLRSEWAKT